MVEARSALEHPIIAEKIRLAATIKRELLRIVAERYSDGLPKVLENGTYVRDMHHSSPWVVEGIVVRNENTQTGRNLYLLTNDGILKLPYRRRYESLSLTPISGTVVPISEEAKEIPVEDYLQFVSETFSALEDLQNPPREPINP